MKQHILTISQFLPLLSAFLTVAEAPDTVLTTPVVESAAAVKLKTKIELLKRTDRQTNWNETQRAQHYTMVARHITRCQESSDQHGSIRGESGTKVGIITTVMSVNIKNRRKVTYNESRGEDDGLARWCKRECYLMSI